MEKPTEPITLLTVVFASRFLDVELVRWRTTYPDGRTETQWELLPYHSIKRLEDFHWKTYHIDED